MAAQVCRTFLSALRNDPEIAAGGDKREAQVEIAGGVLGVGCQHSSSFPGSADTGAGAGDQGLDFRMACVCEMPDVGSQVAGSDENSIHAFDGGDGLDLAYRRLRFYLYENADILMGMAVVVGDLTVAIRALRDGDPTIAERRISCGGDGRLCFLGILHEGNENGASPNIEDPLHHDGIVPGTAHDRFCRTRGHSLQLRKHPGDFVGCVLGIDQNPIETGAGEYLRNDVAAERTPDSNLWQTLCESSFECVGWQER